MRSEVIKLIQQFNLQRHPEGGYFVKTYTSLDRVKLPQKFGDQERASASAILYLLESDDFSAFHKLKADEIWHFHLGSSILVHVISKDGVLETHKLGNPMQDEQALVQVAIKSGEWFAAELEADDSYAFVGCIVAPGWEKDDFELAKSAELQLLYPRYSSLISKLTRN